VALQRKLYWGTCALRRNAVARPPIPKLKAMPIYEWTCLACGHTNRAEVVVCVDCSCPASASFTQIAAYRANFLAKGGEVLPGAGKLPEEGDNEILEVLAKLVLGITNGIFSFPKIK
jgi:hypothetical protein